MSQAHNLTGVPHNPSSRTLGPNKQPSADNLFHHAPANIGRARWRERERQIGEVETVQGHEYSIELESREYPPYPPPPPPPLGERRNPSCTVQHSAGHLLLQSSSPVLKLTLCCWLQPQRGSSSLLARGPGRFPAQA